jgi:hypothetical protein
MHTRLRACRPVHSRSSSGVGTSGSGRGGIARRHGAGLCHRRRER